nr:hypothetical protein [Tanacetum cinerariifolium]
MGCRLLLSQAVNVATAEKHFTPRHHHHLVFREQQLQDLPGRVIHRIVETGSNDAAIDDQKVHVRTGQAHRWVALLAAMHLIHSGALFFGGKQRSRDWHLVRIAVGIEQTLFCGDERALAVYVDRAAFEHEVIGDVAWAAFDFQHFAGDLFIQVPRGVQPAVEAAPGIEAPIDAPYFTVVVDDEGRPGVTHPGVVIADLDDADIRYVQSRTGVVVLGSGYADSDRLEAGDGLGQSDVVVLHRLAAQAPVVRALWPDHPDLRLRRPFGWHVETIGAGGAVESSHSNQNSMNDEDAQACEEDLPDDKNRI